MRSSAIMGRCCVVLLQATTRELKPPTPPYLPNAGCGCGHNVQIRMNEVSGVSPFIVGDFHPPKHEHSICRCCRRSIIEFETLVQNFLGRAVESQGRLNLES